MTPQEEAKYLIDKLGILGAKRQAQEEFGNADNHNQSSHYSSVIDHILQYDHQCQMSILKSQVEFQNKANEIAIKEWRIIESERDKLLEENESLKAINKQLLGTIEGMIELKDKAQTTQDLFPLLQYIERSRSLLKYKPF